MIENNQFCIHLVMNDCYLIIIQNKLIRNHKN